MKKKKKAVHQSRMACSGMYCISNSVPGVFVPCLVYAAALFYIIYGTWVFAPGASILQARMPRNVVKAGFLCFGLLLALLAGGSSSKSA